MKKIETLVVKAIGIAGCIMMTLFAGMWGFLSVAALVMSIIQCDLMHMIGCVAAGCAGWFCWSLRRETLV